MANARETALSVLIRVERGGAYAAAALAAEGKALSDSRDAALAFELVLGVLRQRPWLDHLLNKASTRGLDKIDLEIRYILRLGVCKLAFMERIRPSVTKRCSWV